MYQVIDICTCFAEPTEDLDSITVGMVCVRNLQRNSGRFNGRWSFGDQLWVDYKEIAFDLRHRTREIQYKRGLGPNPNEGDEYDAHGMKINKHFPEDADEDDEDEPDTLDVRYMDKQRTIKVSYCSSSSSTDVYRCLDCSADGGGSSLDSDRRLRGDLQSHVHHCGSVL